MCQMNRLNILLVTATAWVFISSAHGMEYDINEPCSIAQQSPPTKFDMENPLSEENRDLALKLYRSARAITQLGKEISETGRNASMEAAKVRLQIKELSVFHEDRVSSTQNLSEVFHLEKERWKKINATLPLEPRTDDDILFIVGQIPQALEKNNFKPIALFHNYSFPYCKPDPIAENTIFMKPTSISFFKLFQLIPFESEEEKRENNPSQELSEVSFTFREECKLKEELILQSLRETIVIPYCIIDIFLKDPPNYMKKMLARQAELREVIELQDHKVQILKSKIKKLKKIEIENTTFPNFYDLSCHHIYLLQNLTSDFCKFYKKGLNEKSLNTSEQFKEATKKIIKTNKVLENITEEIYRKNSSAPDIISQILLRDNPKLF